MWSAVVFCRRLLLEGCQTVPPETTNQSHSIPFLKNLGSFTASYFPTPKLCPGSFLFSRTHLYFSLEVRIFCFCLTLPPWTCIGHRLYLFTFSFYLQSHRPGESMVPPQFVSIPSPPPHLWKTSPSVRVQSRFRSSHNRDSFLRLVRPRCGPRRRVPVFPPVWCRARRRLLEVYSPLNASDCTPGDGLSAFSFITLYLGGLFSFPFSLI